MKALIQAINNLASSIASLANSLSNKEKTELKDNKSTFIGNTTKSPYSTIVPTEKKIDFSYNTYGSLSFDEREALYKIYKAVFNKGVNEPLHDKVLSNLLNDLKRDWPSLHSAFDNLIKTKTSKYRHSH